MTLRLNGGDRRLQAPTAAVALNQAFNLGTDGAGGQRTLAAAEHGEPDRATMTA